MKEILFNLALLDCMKHCNKHNVDISGSHLVKAPRGYSYTLYKTETGEPIVTTTFYKSSVPRHYSYFKLT